MAAGGTTIPEPETEIDRLSSFCDSILLHILGFLEAIDAVRTCVLSKRWRQLWHSLPNLNFDDGEFRRISRSLFSDYVTQVLNHRDDSSLVKVQFTSNSEIKPLLIESLLEYVVEHGVQEIVLRIGYLEFFKHESSFVFPRCIFDCQSLHELSLTGVTFKEMIFPMGLCLAALTYLYLDHICFSKENFDGWLFSSCPNLKTLQLVDIFCDGLRIFNVQAPNLRTLGFCFTRYDLDPLPDCKVVIVAPRLTNFKFYGFLPMACSVDAPSLEDLSLDLFPACVTPDGQFDGNIILNLIKMLNQFCVAKSITITMDVIEALSALPAMLDGHLLRFGNAKCLTIKMVEYSEDLVLLPCALSYFLNRSTELKFIQQNR